MELAEVSARPRALGEVAAKAALTHDRAHIIAMVLTNGSMAQTGDGNNEIAPTKKERHGLPDHDLRCGDRLHATLCA
jgi:hypothetical protein